MSAAEQLARAPSGHRSGWLWRRSAAMAEGLPDQWASLTAIVAVAIALRVGAAVAFGGGIPMLPGVYDQLSYDALALQVLAGRGFTAPADWWPATSAGQPTAHWSYLYTLYLSAVYTLFGHDPLAARVIQAVVAGILYPWLAWRIGSRLFGQRVALATAGLAAIYGYFVYYAGALMTETFYILAILWALDLTTKMTPHPGAASTTSMPTGSQAMAALPPVKYWLLLGIALGTAALLRQAILLLVPLVFAWLIWATRRDSAIDQVVASYPWRQMIGRLLATSIVIAVLIVPWTARNYQAFDRFVLLNTNAGYAFFWGNHPIHGTDFIAILPSSVYQRLIPTELRGLDEAALDQALLREGLRFVMEDPLRYAHLSLSRVKDYFQFWPSAESSAISNLARILSFGVCLPLMLYGLILSAVRFRSFTSEQQSALVLVYLFAAAYSAVHLLSWALVRYRLPVDAAMLPFAGLALVDLAERLSRRRARAVRGAGP